MRKILLAGVGLMALGVGAPALAADMAARPITKAPPPAPPPIYDWTGFYIGANGGWGQTRNCWGFLPVAGGFISDCCSDRSGGVAGGQLGYRWQFGQFVVGVEGQGDWADLSGRRISTIDPTFTLHTNVDGIGLFTGQLGWAWNQALFYVKGGGAVTGNRFDIRTTIGDLAVASGDATRWGATVGAGFEYGFFPGWSVGVEYDHLFMGDNNNSFSVVNPIVAGAINRVSQDIDMVTVRFNYRFGGYGVGAPVAARY